VALMDGLAAWLQQIIAVLLLAVLVDLLLPNRTMQRYVRLVAGLFILLAIAGPLLRWMQGDIEGRLAEGLKTVGKSSSGSEDGLKRIREEATRMQAKRREDAADLLALRLKEAIRSEVEQSENRPVRSVDVRVGEGEGGVPEVKQVTIVLNHRTEAASADPEPSHSAASLEPVAPVSVKIDPPAGLDGRETLKRESPVDRQTGWRIAARIASRFGIAADRVTVAAGTGEEH
jgi:stage III sporulation protein AF